VISEHWFGVVELIDEGREIRKKKEERREEKRE